jgi:hypothetical protein
MLLIHCTFLTSIYVATNSLRGTVYVTHTNSATCSVFRHPDATFRQLQQRCTSQRVKLFLFLYRALSTT